MAITHTASNSWSNGGSSSSLRSQAIIADSVENNADWTLATGSTDVAFSLTQTASKIQMIALQSSTNLTFKTNSAGSPTQTINLKAGVLEIWHANSGIFSNPITGSITGNVYLTNSSGQQARISVRILSDP